MRNCSRGEHKLFSFTERGKQQRPVLKHAAYIHGAFVVSGLWGVGRAVASSLLVLPEASVATWGLWMRGSEIRGGGAEGNWQGNFARLWTCRPSCSSSYLIVCFDEGTRTGGESREEGCWFAGFLDGRVREYRADVHVRRVLRDGRTLRRRESPGLLPLIRSRLPTLARTNDLIYDYIQTFWRR